MDNRTMFKDAVNLAFLRVFIEIGEKPAFLSKAETIAKYGEILLEKWIKGGLISPDPDNGSFDHIKLEALSMGEKHLSITF